MIFRSEKACWKDSAGPSVEAVVVTGNDGDL